MGNKLTTAVGDTCICFRDQQNRGSVKSERIAQGLGRDLDDAVLASTGDFIDNNSRNS